MLGKLVFGGSNVLKGGIEAWSLEEKNFFIFKKRGLQSVQVFNDFF